MFRHKSQLFVNNDWEKFNKFQYFDYKTGRSFTHWSTAKTTRKYVMPFILVLWS